MLKDTLSGFVGNKAVEVARRVEDSADCANLCQTRHVGILLDECDVWAMHPQSEKATRPLPCQRDI